MEIERLPIGIEQRFNREFDSSAANHKYTVRQLAILMIVAIVVVAIYYHAITNTKIESKDERE